MTVAPWAVVRSGSSDTGLRLRSSCTTCSMLWLPRDWHSQPLSVGALSDGATGRWTDIGDGDGYKVRVPFIHHPGCPAHRDWRGQPLHSAANFFDAMSPYGPVQVAQVKNLGERLPFICVASAELHPGLSARVERMVGRGVDFDLGTAKAKAVSELIERMALFVRPRAALHAGWSRPFATEWSRAGEPAAVQGWFAVAEPDENEAVHVPLPLLRLNGEFAYEGRHYAAASTGVACHPEARAARTAALAEFLERASLVAIWQRSARYCRYDAGSAADARLPGVEWPFAELGFELTAFSHDLGCAHTVLAVATDAGGALAWGARCSHDRDAAGAAALEECFAQAYNLRELPRAAAGGLDGRAVLERLEHGAAAPQAGAQYRALAELSESGGAPFTVLWIDRSHAAASSLGLEVHQAIVPDHVDALLSPDDPALAPYPFQ